jgi:hypothetical protein
LNFFDADDYYWLPTNPPYRVKRNQAERLSLLAHALGSSGHGAVIAGSVMDWGTEIEDSFSLIVFLRVPAVIRVERLRKRELARFGSVDNDFLEWAAQYDEGRMSGRSLQRHEGWLGRRSCKVLRIEGDMPVEVVRQQVIDCVQSDKQA